MDRDDKESQSREQDLASQRTEEETADFKNAKLAAIQAVTREFSMNPEEPGEAEPMSELELNAVIESLCLSKMEEFRMLGYEQVSGKDIWDCVSDKYHKTGVPPLHQVVNDILSLKTTHFMNWITIRVYRGAQL